MEWKDLEAERKRTSALRMKLVSDAEARVVRWEWSVEPLHAIAGPRPTALSPERPGKPLKGPPRKGRYYTYGFDAADRMTLSRYFTPDQDLQSHTVILHAKHGRILVSVQPDGSVTRLTWLDLSAGRVVRERSVGERDRSETRYAYDARRLVAFDDEFSSADGTRTIWKHAVNAKGRARRVEEVVTPGAFDARRFQVDITARVLASFARRPARSRKEKLYAVVLFVNGESGFGYAALSLNTEEGLRRAAKTEAKARELRWSTPDWAYHDCDRALDALVFPTKSTTKTDKAIYESMLVALRGLRASVGPKVVLNVVCGDMSPRFFRKGLDALNPKALVHWALRFPSP